jgi:hypothetical protein
MKLYRTIFLLMLALVARNASASPESDFWTWFQKNEGEIYHFERNQEAVFDKLAARMHQVNPALTFEFGPIKDGKREFVISADGIKEAFPSVEKLHAAAPLLKKWKVTKFRPRREPFDIAYKGVSVQAASVTVVVQKEGTKIAAMMLIPGYTQSMHDTYLGIAFLILDQALGEYDVETRIGAINVSAPSGHFGKASTLAELPKVFDNLLGR